MSKIVRCKKIGFCMGVERAIRKAKKHPKAYLLGGLVHNKQVIQDLEKQNKKLIQEVTWDECHPIVISAHGIQEELLLKLKRHGRFIEDATCVHVKQIYAEGKRLEKEGRQIIIIGDREHIEVKGIASRMKSPIIIYSEDDLERVFLPNRKMGVICQSTCLEDKFTALLALLRQKVMNSQDDYIKAEMTICDPIIQRQKETIKLSKIADILIVVGDRSSSNTKNLLQLAKEYTKAVHIEAAEDLNKEWFQKAEIVGITSGASTPDSIIDNVEKRVGCFS